MAKGHTLKRQPKTKGGVRWATPPVEQVKVRTSWWTVERLLYGLFIIAALFLRVLWLGIRPLSPEEAHQAWLAWYKTQPYAHTWVTGVSPLAYALQWALFLIGGGNDVLARLWSALVGSLIVLIPYGMRKIIGRERALLTALLLTLSTQAVYWSRHASGVSLGLTASLLFVMLLISWLEVDNPSLEENETAPLPVTVLAVRQRGLLWVGIALALLITSDMRAYTVLLSLTLALWPWRKRVQKMWRDVGGQGRHRAAGAFLLTAAVIGGVFLLDIPSIGNVPDLLGAWVKSFWTSSGYPWYWVPFRLAADEPLLMALALWGGIRAWRQHDRIASIWMVWALVTFILGFRPGRTSADAAFLVVPAAFLAADSLWAIIERLRQPSPTWREEMVLLAAFLVILSFWFMMISGYLRVGDTRYVPAIIIVPILLVGLAFLYTYWLSREASWRVAITSLIITGILWSWMALWVQNLHLAKDAALDALPGIERTTTHRNVRMLVHTLERISAETQTDWHEADVDVLLPSEGADVLRWYLRDFKNVRVVPSIKDFRTSIAIAPASAGEAHGYTGMDWILTTSMLPTELGAKFYHWWFYREAPLSDHREEIILWFKRSQ